LVQLQDVSERTSKMKLTIKKITENQYTVQEGDKEIVNLGEKSIIVDKRTGCSYLRLPENSLKIQSINLKRFKDSNVIEFENMRTQRQTTSTEKSKKNWTDYLNDEEKEMYERFKKNAEERMRQEKEEEEKKKNDPVEKAKKKVNYIIENLKKLGMTDEQIKRLISEK
jgi:hypothetical protein